MAINVKKPEINVRAALNKADKPSGIAGEELLRTKTHQERFTTLNAGRRNWFINGDFRISQRGTFASATNIANGEYGADRWKIRNSRGAGDMTIQLVDDLPPNVYSGKSYKLAAVNTYSLTQHMGIQQYIEDYESLIGKVITYSCWVKSNFKVQPWIYEFGDSNIVSVGTHHSGSGQWEFLTVSRRITRNNNVNSVITYLTNYGSHYINGGDYHISTQHQLEIGEQHTEFEQRTTAEELALCQRYYYKSSGVYQAGYVYAPNNSVDGMRTSWNFPVTMRANPATSISGGSDGGSASSIEIIADSENSATINLRSTNASYDVWWQGGTITADAEL